MSDEAPFDELKRMATTLAVFLKEPVAVSVTVPSHAAERMLSVTALSSGRTWQIDVPDGANPERVLLEAVHDDDPVDVAALARRTAEHFG